MKAVVTVDVDLKHARISLGIAGYDVEHKTDQEILEMAIRMNDCYAVNTLEINTELEPVFPKVDSHAEYWDNIGSADIRGSNL